MLISYEKAEREIQRITTEMEVLANKLKKYPDGELQCLKNGAGYKWYVVKGKKREYLAKKEENLAKKLAAKKYLFIKKRDLQYELKGLQKYCCNIRKIKEKMNNSETILMHDGYARLLRDFFENSEEESRRWMHEDYEKCSKNPESLIIKGTGGKMLRSKSEAMIDLLLYSYGIPFRYENKISFDRISLYPDFTIRLPRTGEIFLWEHFGLMDDIRYVENVYEKLKLYSQNGFILGINLIATFETAEHPLSTEDVRHNIERYLL